MPPGRAYPPLPQSAESPSQRGHGRSPNAEDIRAEPAIRLLFAQTAGAPSSSTTAQTAPPWSEPAIRLAQADDARDDEHRTFRHEGQQPSAVATPNGKSHPPTRRRAL